MLVNDTTDIVVPVPSTAIVVSIVGKPKSERLTLIYTFRIRSPFLGIKQWFTPPNSGWLLNPDCKVSKANGVCRLNFFKKYVICGSSVRKTSWLPTAYNWTRPLDIFFYYIIIARKIIK